MNLRPYQLKLKDDIYEAWASGFKNVLSVLPTGGGKTLTFCVIAHDMAYNQNKVTAIIVHRKELVQQICMTLASQGIVHNILAPRNVILGIISQQRLDFKRQFYDHTAPITVISVDTLNARILRHEKWAKSVRFWIVDEATHVTKVNKWGRAIEYFPNAIGLGVTATPERLDKRGLGSHADGVFDHMVQGPSTRWLIQHDFLCNYRLAIPESDYEQYLKPASEGSDFTREAMSIASQKSGIIGDVVKSYRKYGDGKQCIVFADSITSGQSMEDEFNSQGIPAKLLTGETEDKVRLNSLIEYREKKIKVLINVDLFDEGLDVPGIELVSLARPTWSLGKALQMVGRGLRKAKGKDRLIIIDHVGNFGINSRHGLPDNYRKWTLDRITKKRSSTNLVRLCSNPVCAAPYDRTLVSCPYCGSDYVPQGGGGGGPKKELQRVDGDLVLLDPETIRQLEGMAHLEDPGSVAHRVSKVAGKAAGIKAAKAQQERIETQKLLVETIAKWAGRFKRDGWGDRQINKHFYLTYGRSITEVLGETKALMLDTIEELKWV